MQSQYKINIGPFKGLPLSIYVVKREREIIEKSTATNVMLSTVLINNHIDYRDHDMPDADLIFSNIMLLTFKKLN